MLKRFNLRPVSHSMRQALRRPLPLELLVKSIPRPLGLRNRQTPQNRPPGVVSPATRWRNARLRPNNAVNALHGTSSCRIATHTHTHTHTHARAHPVQTRPQQQKHRWVLFNARDASPTDAATVT